MSKPSRDDAPNPKPDPPPTEADQAQIDADAEYQQAAEMEERDRRWERVGTQRIEGYARLIEALGVLLRPVGGETFSAKSVRLDQLTRGEINLAIKAVAIDVQRLARFCGPRTDLTQSNGGTD